MRTIADIFRSYAVLNEAGVHINGTDKESNHRYGKAYEAIFSVPPHTHNEYLRKSIREDIRLMMEVGVADGSSLLAWREVFPNALCVGMDIHPAQRLLDAGSRIEFHLGDQRSKEDCERAVGGRLFDVIVEDATHELQNTLLTLLYLWPFVRPGGLYIVEEFANVGGLVDNVRALWPWVEFVVTRGPSGGIEPLVVFRKPR